MSLKNEIQQLNNRIDTCRHKMAAAEARGDKAMTAKFSAEITKLTKKTSSLKHKLSYDLNKERKELSDMEFSRELTKAEQADLGKLKKSVKGLVVVHPMTKLGKALRIDAMTGFAPKQF